VSFFISRDIKNGGSVIINKTAGGMKPACGHAVETGSMILMVLCFDGTGFYKRR